LVILLGLIKLIMSDLDRKCYIENLLYLKI